MLINGQPVADVTAQPDPPASGAPDLSFQTAFTDAASQSPPAAPSPAPAPAPAAVAPPAAQVPAGTPAPAPAATAPAQQPESQVTGWARALGLQVRDGASDAEVTTAVMQRMAQMQAAAQSPPAASPAAQPSAEPEQWTPESYFRQQWQSPEWRQEYDFAIDQGIVQRDPKHGLFVAAPGFELMAAPILQGLNQAAQAQRQQWQEIMQGNPFERFHKVLQEPLQRAWKSDIDAAVQRHLRQLREEQAADSYERENANWMFQPGPSGTPVPTQKGQQFFDTVASLQKAGIQDLKTLLSYAERLCGVGQHSGQPAAAPTAAAPAAAATPATVPFPAQPAAAPAPTAPAKSFMQEALERAQHNAQTVPGTASSDDPGRISQGDLESMFVSAARASRGQPAA